MIALARSLAGTCIFASIVSAPARAQWSEPEAQELLEVSSPTPNDTFGWLVLSVGDVTGDGLRDVVTTAPLSSAGAPSGGRVTAHSGADGSLIWARNETLPSAILGYALEVADWNGDGTLDVLAGAPFNGTNGGRVWVFDGASGATLTLIDPGDFGQDAFGSSLAVGHDFDGDGVDDLAVGAPGFDLPGVPNAGRLWVFSGATGAVITALDAPVPGGGVTEFGISLACLGDVSVPADGRAEFAVGERDANQFFLGAAHFVSHNGTAAQFTGSIPGIGMDYSLAGNRFDGGLDIDGDGAGDLLVSASQGESATVYSGRTGALVRSFDGNGEGGNFGTGHLMPDVNGDGRADLVLGARGNDTGAVDAGRIFVYSGATGAVLRTLTYTVSGRRIGREARAIGDQDGDGLIDFAVAGTGGGTNGLPEGRLVLVRGSGLFPTYCDSLVNSTGGRARIGASGVSSVSAANLVLHAAAIPNRAGVFLHGSLDVQAPFGNGFQCVAGNLARGSIVHPTSFAASYAYDGSSFAHDLAPFVGQTRHFQYWYRDREGGGAMFNTSDGISIPILP